MNDTPDLVDPFHRQLYGVISEDIARRVSRLATGSASAIIDGVTTVAENYAAQVSYIQALNDILAKCQEIEVERYGGRRGADD